MTQVSMVLKGKAGLVTGGASGIGRASAVAFAEAGGAVVVADLESARTGGEETVALIEAAGGTAQFVPTDVTSEADVKGLVECVVDSYGRLDFAFNNAGIATMGFTADYEEKDFDRIIAVDLKSVWLCMKHEIRYMKDHGGGNIVNTASEAGLTGLPSCAPYVAAKHGVVGLTKTAAAEYANMGIRINAIAPGAIATPMATLLHEEAQQMLIAPQPLQRYGTPEEVAQSALFLLSDSASFIVGTVLSVDGGAMTTSQSYNPALNPSAS